MADTLAPGGIGQANHSLSVLRDGTMEGALGHDMVFVPGLELHADPGLELTGSFTSSPGRLIDLDICTGTTPRGWLALHLAVPESDLGQTAAIGFAARLWAPEIRILHACLRSGTREGFEDRPFDRHILVRREEALHLDALPTGGNDVPQRAPWRELVLFLPLGGFRISLLDLRVFAA